MPEAVADLVQGSRALEQPPRGVPPSDAPLNEKGVARKPPLGFSLASGRCYALALASPRLPASQTK
jgi:hypothetical protein